MIGLARIFYGEFNMKLLCKAFVLLALPAVALAASFAGCRSAGNWQSRNVWAVIDGAAVTESDIRDAAADDLESIELRKLHTAAVIARDEREAMIKAMERVLEEKLLALEAAEHGISREQLIERDILGKIEDPSEEEIDLVYELNRTRVNRPKEDVAEQIKIFLRSRSEQDIRDAFLERLEQKHTVVRNLEPLRFDVKTDGHPSIGPGGAPVKIVLFSDYECPYCRDLDGTLMEIAVDYGDKVQIVFRQFPLPGIHPNAERAAEASLCAHEQGRFQEVHGILFENQRDLTEVNILTQIKSLDLDTEKFRECLVSGRRKQEIREDVRAGNAAGADSTPTIFINGLYMSGAQPYDAIAAVINKELANQ